MKALPMALLAAAAAVLATAHGRGVVGSALISAGAALLPDPTPDDERDRRIADRVLRSIIAAPTMHTRVPL